MASPTIATRVLDELWRSGRPLDDDELARRISVGPRQAINQVCRRLERSGRLRRYTGPEGKIVNDVRLPSAAHFSLPAPVSAGGSTFSSPSSSVQDAWYGTGFARFPQRSSVPKKKGSSPAGTCAARAGIAADRSRPSWPRQSAPRPAAAPSLSNLRVPNRAI